MLSERRQPKNVVYYRVSVYHILSFPGALVVKNTPANAGHIRDLGLIPGSRRSPKEVMATHSSILAWRIPWTEEPGGLQSIGLKRVRHY